MRKDKRYKEIVAAETARLENEYSYAVATFEKMVAQKIEQCKVVKRQQKARKQPDVAMQETITYLEISSLRKPNANSYRA